MIYNGGAKQNPKNFFHCGNIFQKPFERKKERSLVITIT